MEDYEQAVQEIREYYETIILCMPGNVYWLDTSLKARGCNQNVLDMFGFHDINQFIGLSFDEMGKICGWTSEAINKFKNDSAQVLETKKPLLNQEEPPIRHANGKMICFLTHRVPILNKNNDILGVVGISIDITERKEIMDKLEKANKAKSEFIANMSHDIRTPLTGIIGLSSVLESEITDLEQKEHAHMLNISGEQLLSLLNSVLDIVASDTIKDKNLNLVEFDLEEMLQNIFELELPAIQVKSITFKLKIDANVPKIIASDKGKIYRILLNLISNAIKFTSEGSVTLKARLPEKNNSHPLLQFDVSDTGMGIDERDKDQIFEPFFRATPSYEGKFAGHGVGLSIVKQYIKSMDGTIHVDSKRNIGTTITIILPFKAVGFETIKAQSLEKDFKSPQKKNLSPANNSIDRDKSKPFILLVEDNPMAMRVASTLLKKVGCRFEQAENATDALNKVKEHRFDFLLSDIGLPDFSGFILSKKILEYEREQDLSPTPIIGLTAHAKNEAKAQQESSGMVDILEKPLKIEELHRLIQTHCPDLLKKTNLSSKAIDTDLSDRQDYLPLFEFEKAIELLGTKQTVLETIEFMLNEELEQAIPDIDAAFQTKDWKQFKAKIHKFKSSCLYSATTALLNLTKTLQDCALDEEEIKKISTYRQFEKCVHQTKQFLGEWLKSNRN